MNTIRTGVLYFKPRVGPHNNPQNSGDLKETIPMSALPYVASVHRPGLPDVHLGFVFAHQAEHASWSLTDDLRNTQHVEGTTITWSPTPDVVSPLAPLPTDSYAVAELIDQEDNDLPMGHAFPDLFSRLKAQEGYETAARIWRNACRWLDYEAEEADQ